MEYRDEYISLRLPPGFSFRDRPNYCTWNFARGDELVSVLIATRDGDMDFERTVREAGTFSVPDYDISGPYEYEFADRKIVSIESVKRVPGRWYSKQTQVAVLHADFAALVVINGKSAYQVAEYLPFFESIRASATDIEAIRDSFLPERKRKGSKRRAKRGRGKPSLELPPQVAYLQPALNELREMPQDEEIDASDLDVFDEVVRQRIEGLLPAEAEKRLSADYDVLESWCKEDAVGSAPSGILLTVLDAFITYTFVLPSIIHDTQAESGSKKDERPDRQS